MPIPKNIASGMRFSAKEKAYNQLQRWIIEGVLTPGEKLYDSEIAEALQISRTPVREALQLLEFHQFIETFPGKTTRVKPINPNDIQKIYPILASIHSLASEEAAKVITPSEIERLKDINRNYLQSVLNKEPFESMEYDEDFHNLILDIAENTYITKFSATLQLHMRRLKYAFLDQQLSASYKSVEEHSLLIEALEKKEPMEASNLMKKNWLRPMNEMRSIYSE